MINYCPIILRSTESDSSIWLEIRGSIIESGEKHLYLHLVCYSDTKSDGRSGGTYGGGFYSGTEEYFRQIILSMPVSKSALEVMVDEIHSKLTDAAQNSDSLEYKFSFMYKNQSRILVQILKHATEQGHSFQVGFLKEDYESTFQIKTSLENILLFIRELNEKIRIHQ